MKDEEPDPEREKMEESRMSRHRPNHALILQKSVAPRQLVYMVRDGRVRSVREGADRTEEAGQTVPVS